MDKLDDGHIYFKDLEGGTMSSCQIFIFWNSHNPFFSADACKVNTLKHHI